MKMKRRRRSTGALAAGVAGFSVVLIATLALNFFGFQGQGQAQGEQPILPTEVRLPTPTVAPSPTALSSVASVVLASPEFRGPDSLSQWEFVDVGVRLPEERSVWKVMDGALFQDRTAGAATARINETMAFMGSPDWTDYTVSARFYDQGNGNVGVVARRQGESFYRFQLIADQRSDTPKLILEKVVKGEATRLASLDAPGYQFDTWYDIALSVQGARIQAFVNGKPVLEAQDATLASGQPGLYTRALGAIRFGGVTVTEQ